jgi:hypothetical protein
MVEVPLTSSLSPTMGRGEPNIIRFSRAGCGEPDIICFPTLAEGAENSILCRMSRWGEGSRTLFAFPALPEGEEFIAGNLTRGLLRCTPGYN